MVGLVTLTSFIMWFYRMGFANRRVKFIRKYLKIMSVLQDTDKAASHKFVENYLRPDGVFLIRLIAINVGDLMAGDLACELWHIYRHKRLHEAKDQKYLDATGMLSDLVLPYDPGAPGSGDIPLNVAGRLMDKHPAPSAPLTNVNSAANNNLSGSNNNNTNDDSIV
ncbi:Innexin [Fasciolopsis buskii]|uniref:Innexin n=1 Tax=Fasciolopsis buskii TaxID=27845 RepID=A0A8E0RVZ3_9TREM|nr:Innexin [Fasciolopsis buski]